MERRRLLLTTIMGGKLNGRQENPRSSNLNLVNLRITLRAQTFKLPMAHSSLQRDGRTFKASYHPCVALAVQLFDDSIIIMIMHKTMVNDGVELWYEH